VGGNFQTRPRNIGKHPIDCDGIIGSFESFMGLESWKSCYEKPTQLEVTRQAIKEGPCYLFLHDSVTVNEYAWDSSPFEPTPTTHECEGPFRFGAYVNQIQKKQWKDGFGE
jgi:hypothetical protein